MTLSIPITPKDHVLGDPNAAKIVLLEYGDFQCSYCKVAHTIVKQLQEDYGTELAFVFRNFPLVQIHGHALRAAEAAEIAGDFGKYWKMHDTIFEYQENLSEEELQRWTAQMGIEAADYDRELNQQTKRQQILNEAEQALQMGVKGTPTFFVNGRRYDGDLSLEALKSYMDSL